MIYTPIAGQWKTLIIEPVLTRLGDKYNSPVAVNLLLGTIAVESKFQYIAQYPKGPGRGYYQIEPETALDVVRRNQRIFSLMTEQQLENWLLLDLEFQTEVARFKYYDAAEILPEDKPAELALYWAKHYNTRQSSLRFVDAWFRYVAA